MDPYSIPELHFDMRDLGSEVGRGATAEVRELGEKQVVKLFLSEIPLSRHSRELHALWLLRDTPAHQPHIYGTVRIEHRNGIVLERLRGRSLLSLMVASPWRVATYSQQMADLHVRLNGLDAPPRMDNLKRRLTSDITECTELPEDVRDRLLIEISQLPDGKRLCHLDYHPGNILIGEDGESRVVDWVNACVGDPMADVARTYGMLLVGLPPGLGAIERVTVAGFQRIAAELYLRRYLRISRRSREEVMRWFVPMNAARLRENIPEVERARVLAVVLQRNVLGAF